MNPALFLLMLALFLWGMGEGLFFFFQPLYLQELGADPILIGAILGAMGIAMTIAHIPAGYLADKIGRLPLLRAAWISGVISAWLMALANDLRLFVAGLLLYGFTAFVAAPLSSYVTAARGNMPVGRVLTMVSATFSLGMIAGPFIGGWLGDTYGLRTVYFAAAVLFGLSTVIVFFLKPQPREEAVADLKPSGLLSNHRYLGFLAISFVVMFALYLPQPLTPNFLQNERGLLLSQIGLLGTISALGNVLLNLGIGSLFSARTGFIIGQVFAAFFAYLIWQGAGLPYFALGYFLLGGYRVARSLATAQVRQLIHETQMGLAYGITETVNSLPIVLAPPIAGILYAQHPALIYPISLAVIGFTVLVTLIYAPRERTLVKTFEPGD